MSLRREDGVFIASYDGGREQDRLHFVLAGETLSEGDLAAVPEDQYMSITWKGDEAAITNAISARIFEAAKAKRHEEVAARFWGEVFKPQIGPGATSSTSPEEERALQELLSRR